MNDDTPHARFRAMARMRHFEQACLIGSRSGEIHGELHLGIGQEAIAAGMVGSLEPGDAVVSTHRNHLHGLAKGVDATALMAEIFEKDTGLCRGRGGHMHPFDLSTNFSATGIVGASLPVALGYAYAFWMEERSNIAVGVTGEGGANAGTFHECMNIAAAWNLPFLILVENNRYAISVNYDNVMATPTLAERAAGYGAWGRDVDGTDAEIVAEAFAEAANHLRSGKGPAILEASCWRFRGHYEGDHDGYRDREERQRNRTDMDPLLVTRRSLIETGKTSAETLDAIDREAKEEMDRVLETVREAPLPAASGALHYRYVTP